MLFNEAKFILKSNGYIIQEDFEGDFFIDIEDILSDNGYDAEEIQKIMHGNAEKIAELADQGYIAEDVVKIITSLK